MRLYPVLSKIRARHRRRSLAGFDVCNRVAEKAPYFCDRMIKTTSLWHIHMINLVKHAAHMRMKMLQEKVAVRNMNIIMSMRAA